MSNVYNIALNEYPIEWVVRLCGTQDKNLEIIRFHFDCEIVLRDNQLRIVDASEESIQQIEKVVKSLFDMMEHHIEVEVRDIE